MAKKIEIGAVLAGPKNRGWITWNEIIAINGNMLTVTQYGKTTREKEVTITENELRYALRKGIVHWA